MVQFKDKQVVLILTNEKPIEGTILFRNAFGDKSLWQYKETFVYKCGTEVFRTLNGSFEDWSKAFQPQHLYVVSDDEIKKDDWVTDGIKVMKATSKLVEAQNLVDRREWKKIIETTNTTLSRGYETVKFQGSIIGESYHSLPQPSQEFIKEFIESYNKENNLPFKLVRNNYSKEEVRIKLKASFYKGVEAESGQLDLDFNIDKWIEENL